MQLRGVSSRESVSCAEFCALSHEATACACHCCCCCPGVADDFVVADPDEFKAWKAGKTGYTATDKTWVFRVMIMIFFTEHGIHPFGKTGAEQIEAIDKVRAFRRGIRV